MPSFSPHEARAHVTIVQAIADYQDCCISGSELVRRAQPALESFAPRCPGCRNVLSYKAAVGLVFVSCSRCGHKHVEAR